MPLKSTQRLSLCIALLIGTGGTAHTDDVILIGGGYDPSSSQVQIEANVIWAQQVMTELGLNTSTWFSDGEAPQADVVLGSEFATSSPLEPIARVFGDRHRDRLQYRNHQVSDVIGGTEVSGLLPALQDRLTQQQEPVFLMYNGHGSPTPDTEAGVSINLWDRTTLSARDLHDLVTSSTNPMRWVFTQCFSGGFHRLAYENVDDGLTLTEPPRCGFTAESAYNVAEGCSASLTTDDYRDYSTYFLAALSGRERNGDFVLNELDLNGDGLNSPREAHLFTLEQADSTDLSRATSEDYLEAWQPWFLRWLPLRPQLPDNEYSRVYRNIASRLQISLTTDTPKQLRLDIRELQAQVHDLQLRRQSLQQEERALQQILIQDLTGRYPALLGPYTAQYVELVNSGEILEIADAIAGRPDYTDLVIAQDADDALDEKLLSVERAITQRLKMLRMRRLAHLVDQLDRHGSDSSKRDYASLVSCEERPL